MYKITEVVTARRNNKFNLSCNASKKKGWLDILRGSQSNWDTDFKKTCYKEFSAFKMLKINVENL